MTAKPWGECPLCEGERLFWMNDDSGVAFQTTCPCAAARRAAFEEAKEIVRLEIAFCEVDIRPPIRRSVVLRALDRVRAAIRAKMEGEK